MNDASINTDPAASASAVDVKPAASCAAETDFDMSAKDHVCEVTKEMAEKVEKYNKCKQLLQDEKAKCNKYADELAQMELKWKEQVRIAENVKLELAELEDSYSLQLAEKDKEINCLASFLENLSREKELTKSLEDQKEGKWKARALNKSHGVLTPALSRVGSSLHCRLPSQFFSMGTLTPHTRQEMEQMVLFIQMKSRGHLCAAHLGKTTLSVASLLETLAGQMV